VGGVRRCEQVEWAPLLFLLDKSDNEDTMDEQRKHAILFAATILAARKLNESGIKPWGIEVAISDAVSKAELILEKIDQRWPTERAGEARR